MQVASNVKLIVCLSVLQLFIHCNDALKVSAVNTSYYNGVQAYSGERWSECIVQFEESLHLYKLHKTIVINCRLKCKSQTYEPIVTDQMEDLKIYEKFFNTRDCLDKCQNRGFEDTRLISELDEVTLANMQMRKPYQYLHICYFQMNMLPKAASAAFTYLVANPDDDSMVNNLKYYLDQPEIDATEIVDFLSEDYMVLYKLGLQSYKKSNWGETIANMEEVILDYLAWENSCRAECERQPEQEWSPEFTTTVANNIASLLHCRQHCQESLKPLKYNSGVEFLAEVLNYLQISYYRLDRLDDAAKTVASFLMLLPKDEDMLINKNIYETIAPNDAFKARPDIVYYMRRDKYEKDLLHFFHQGNDNGVDTNSI